MAAEVSSLNRNPNSLITQDLLAGLSRPDDPLDLMSRQSYLDPMSEVQDLNYPPTKTSYWSLELKLDSSRTNYESVCTLDKVKSALERAESKKRPSNTTSSCGVFASACPGCFLYVIAQKTNPKCPRCDAVVPPPPKKPRIDLNSMQQLV